VHLGGANVNLIASLSGWAKQAKGWPFIISIVLIGTFFFVVGELVTPTYTTVGPLCSKVGTVIIGGSVGGVILKLLATEGYFQDAVAQVIYGPEGLKRLSSDQLSVTWRTLTSRIYMPNLLVAAGEKAADYEKLRHALQDAVASRFKYDADLLITNLNRHMEFTVPAPGEVRLVETTISTLLPFDPTKELSWKHQIQTDSGAKLSDYELKDEYKLGDGSMIPTKVHQSDDGTSMITTYTLPAGVSHEVMRTKDWRWSIDKDPVFNFISPYLIQAATVTVVNSAPGVRVVLKDIGEKDLFSPFGGGKKIIEAGQKTILKTKKMILPEQGFLGVLLRIQQPEGVDSGP